MPGSSKKPGALIGVIDVGTRTVRFVVSHCCKQLRMEMRALEREGHLAVILLEEQSAIFDPRTLRHT